MLPAPSTAARESDRRRRGRKPSSASLYYGSGTGWRAFDGDASARTRIAVLVERWAPVLRAPSRFTNLGVLLLAALAACSLLLNAAYFFSADGADAHDLAHGPSPRRWGFPGPPFWPGRQWNVNSTAGAHPPFGRERAVRVARPAYAQYLDHLIIVPGHSVWKGATPDSAAREDAWALEDFQRGKGRHATFLEHIEKG
jgi:hypothetical protein